MTEVNKILNIFTPRQISILVYFMYGWKSSEVANVLNCSQTTIRNHVYQMVHKAGFRTINQLMFHIGQNVVIVQLNDLLNSNNQLRLEDNVRLLLATGGNRCINAQLNKKKS